MESEDLKNVFLTVLTERLALVPCGHQRFCSSCVVVGVEVVVVVAAAAAAAVVEIVVVVVVVCLHDNNKSVTGMNTILNLHHANKALTEVHNL